MDRIKKRTRIRMKIPNLIFQEITKEEFADYLEGNDVVPATAYPGNPARLPGEIGFHKKKRIRLVVERAEETVFSHKREGLEDKKIAKLFGLNLKSKFRKIINS